MTRIISLRSSADFERVLRSGRRASSGAITCAVHRRTGRSDPSDHRTTPAELPAGAPTPAALPSAAVPLSAGPRFGFTVTRKVGGAVARNRAKRRLREAVRQLAEHVPPDVDVVIGARGDTAGKSYQDLVTDLRTAMTKAGISCS